MNTQLRTDADKVKSDCFIKNKALRWPQKVLTQCDFCYAEDFVLAAGCELELQTSLDAVSVRGHRFMFKFGVGGQNLQ